MSRSDRLFAVMMALILVAVGCGGPDEDETLAFDDSLEPGAGVIVTQARASWISGYFQAAVYRALLEELGYQVTDPADLQLAPTDAYTAMAEGTVDFWVNSWFPNHDRWLANRLDDGTTAADHVVVVGEQLMGSGLEGLLITKAVVDEWGIETMAQINDDPALTALFDSDGNGKGEVFGCAEEWTCDDILGDLLANNGWDNLEQITSDYDEMIAESLRRAEAGEPMMQYTWSPSGYLTQLIPGENVLWLAMGPEIEAGEPVPHYAEAGAAVLGDYCTADPCHLGWASADIRVTANNEFAAANPAAIALFEVVTFSVLDVAEQNAKYDSGENTEADVRRHAADWIEANRFTVDRWLAAARAAG